MEMGCFLYFIYLNRDYLESRFLYLTINRVIATGVFTQTMKNNPRLTYTVVGTTAVFSLFVDIMCVLYFFQLRLFHRFAAESNRKHIQK